MNVSSCICVTQRIILINFYFKFIIILIITAAKTKYLYLKIFKFAKNTFLKKNQRIERIIEKIFNITVGVSTRRTKHIWALSKMLSVQIDFLLPLVICKLDKKIKKIANSPSEKPE